MKLRVDFRCEVKIHELEKNYTGKVTLLPEQGDTETFYFLVINPYGGSSAEMSLYKDEEQAEVFAEAVGTGILATNPHTSKPVTAYDFRHIQDVSVCAVIFILSQIISEAIYRTELEWKDKAVKMRQGDLPTSHFESFWENDFVGETEMYAKEFIERYGMY